MFSMIAEPPTRIGNSAPIRVTIDCAQCGTAIPSTQTKSLDSTLDTYRVGDVVSAEGITAGVLTEELYCEPCRKFDQKIYMTLWHGLITGFYTDEAEAERKLLAVDRAGDLEHAKSQLDQQGYCIVEGVIGRDAAEEQLEHRRVGPDKKQYVSFLLNKGQGFRDLLFVAEMRALVEHVLGPHYLLSSYSGHLALPGGSRVFHRDQWWMPVPIIRGQNTSLRAGVCGSPPRWLSRRRRTGSADPWAAAVGHRDVD